MRCIIRLFVMAIFALSLIPTGAIALEGNVANNGWDYTGQIIVITAAPGSMVRYCGVTLEEYNVEVINPVGSSFGFITMAFPQGSNVSTGMHFKVLSQDGCSGDSSRINLELEQTDVAD